MFSQDELDKNLKAFLHKDNYVAFERLLQLGANPSQMDALGVPLLLTAIENDYIEISKLLLENGANPNIGWADWTPLMTAASRGNLKICETLLIFGAKLEHKNSEGVDAMYWSKNLNHQHITDFFNSVMENESLIDSINTDQQTLPFKF